MQGTLNYRDTVRLESGDARFIKIIAAKQKVTVELFTVGNDDEMRRMHELPWDKLDNVEHLAQVFGSEQVCVFAVLAKLLGDAYRVRDLL